MKKKSLASFFIFSFFASQLATAGGHVLKKGAIICDSEEKFDEQLDRIVRHDFSIVRGCGISPGPIDVELIDASLLGATKVYVPAIKNYIYIDRNDLY